MSQISVEHGGHGHGGDDHHGHHHDPHVAHHFDSAGQQFSSGKLGMWLFLATEILFFGGLFTFYSVWRANHPEIFETGSLVLDWKLGAVNTVVLILSSFTMAWGVTAAQLGQTKLLKFLLSLTIAGGATFMVIKYFEYKAKIDHQTVWGAAYSAPGDYITSHYGEHGGVPMIGEAPGHGDDDGHGAGGHADETHQAESGARTADASAAGQTDTALTRTFMDEAGWDPYHGAEVEVTHSQFEPAASGPSGLASERRYVTRSKADPKDIATYFSIYFCLTGLHGIHVLVGMGLIGWILWRTTRGEFGPKYFTPVDLVGLYWHLVDLIWIFLFPLLYLI